MGINTVNTPRRRTYRIAEVAITKNDPACMFAAAMAVLANAQDITQSQLCKAANVNVQTLYDMKQPTRYTGIGMKRYAALFRYFAAHNDVVPAKHKLVDAAYKEKLVKVFEDNYSFLHPGTGTPPKNWYVQMLIPSYKLKVKDKQLIDALVYAYSHKVKRTFRTATVVETSSKNVPTSNNGSEIVTQVSADFVLEVSEDKECEVYMRFAGSAYENVKDVAEAQGTTVRGTILHAISPLVHAPSRA